MTHALTISLGVFLIAIILGAWHVWRDNREWEHDYTPHEHDVWIHPERGQTPTPTHMAGKHGRTPARHDTYRQRKPTPRH